MPRLTEFGTRNRGELSEHLDDIREQEVTIFGVDVLDGEWGPFVIFQAEDENGLVHRVVTGAQYVVDALEDAKERGALPVSARFYRSGRVWLFE